MKRSHLIELIREVLDEMSTTGGLGYLTPNMFAKPGQGKNAATKQGERLGLKTVKRPKHPSHTKMFDYLHEDGGGTADVPYAFTTEEGLYAHDGVKISEKLEMELVDNKKKSTVNKNKK